MASTIRAGWTRASCSLVARGASSLISPSNSGASSARSTDAEPVGAFGVIRAGVMLQTCGVSNQRGGQIRCPLAVGIRSAADEEAQDAGLFAHGDQGVAGFLAERLEIGDGGAVGGKHAQLLPGRHRTQRTIGAQNGQAGNSCL